ncbi:hypothetical protein C4552_01995 [Candidatus Parcubacteria bacterium]|nr:MAG: hypothetical protein C4552_01995 [Candidatus Parcubacteria bacterium]
MIRKKFPVSLLLSVARIGTTVVLMFALAIAQTPGFVALAQEAVESTAVENAATDSPTPEPEPEPTPEPEQSTTESEPEPAPETIIVTGDADSNTDIQNFANTNATEFTAESEPGEPAPIEEAAPPAEEPVVPAETASSTESGNPEETNQTQPEPMDLGVETGNEAAVANDATTTSATGTNDANQNSGNATIATGDATADANVVNFVNTNAVGSDVEILTLNATSSDQSFDVRSAVSSTTPADDLTACPTGCFASSTLAVDNQNAATTTNTIAVEAATGDNNANANGGDALVVTGDAWAAANVANFLNSNFVGSRFMLVTLNYAADWTGDLVLPGHWFYEGLLAGAPPLVVDDASVSNTNTATVINEIVTTADTGQNSASANGDGGTVVTGTATALSNVATIANTNVFDPGAALFVLVQVGGRWGGTIFSLPSGADWKLANGQLVISGGAATSSSGASLPPDMSVANENTAFLVNTVDVAALTGGNSASGNGGSGNIFTGDATALANVFNMVNTNVISQNWLVALINIAGDWNGSIAFGRPDLWIGERVIQEAPGTVSPGSKVTYQLLVANNGDAPATDVVLTDTFDSSLLQITEGGTDGTLWGDGLIGWDIGTLPVGGWALREYTTSVQELPYGFTAITNQSEIAAYEPDNNAADNADSTTLLGRYTPSFHITGGAAPVDFKISKTSDASEPLLEGRPVHYAITAHNVDTGSATDVYVVDIMTAADGTVINESAWELGVVGPREEITIEYDIEFSSTTPPGTYINTAFVEGTDGWGNYFRSAFASTTVTILGTVATTSADADGSGTTTPAVEPPAVSEPEITREEALEDALDSGGAEAADAEPVAILPALGLPPALASTVDVPKGIDRTSWASILTANAVSWPIVLIGLLGLLGLAVLRITDRLRRR